MNLVGDIIAQRSLLDYMPADISLKLVGKDAYRSRCPITDGDSLSFAIRRHRNGHFVFRCFSCNVAGTVIDLYAALNKCSVRTAIVQLAAGAERMSPEVEMQRAEDQFRRQHGSAVVACDKCGTVEEIVGDISEGISLMRGHNWRISRSGKVALCPVDA